MLRGVFMIKFIGNSLLALAILYPTSALTNTPVGKAVLCGKEEELTGYYFSNSRVHLYDDSLIVQPLSREEYTQTFDYLSWGNWRLNRKTLELENTKLPSKGQCELMSLTGMINKLAESRQQKMAGNKL